MDSQNLGKGKAGPSTKDPARNSSSLESSRDSLSSSLSDAPEDTASAPSPYRPFPAAMIASAEWGQFKTFDLCDAASNKCLYLVESHMGFSGKGPLGTRPGFQLHNGTSKKDLILAATGDKSKSATRIYAFCNDSLVLMPPLPGTPPLPADGGLVTEWMRGSVDGSKEVVFRFSIEVGNPHKEEVRRERFEWRKMEKGTDEAVKEGGFRPVAAADASGPHDGASSVASGSFTPSTGGQNDLARLGWIKLFPNVTQAFRLELVGRGQTGELGERWVLMVVMTALRLWALRVGGKTAKPVVSAGQKLASK